MNTEILNLIRYLERAVKHSATLAFRLKPDDYGKIELTSYYDNDFKLNYKTSSEIISLYEILNKESLFKVNYPNTNHMLAFYNGLVRKEILDEILETL